MFSNLFVTSEAVIGGNEPISGLGYLNLVWKIVPKSYQPVKEEVPSDGNRYVYLGPSI